MRVLFFVSEFNRFNGGQRSLRQLLVELPNNKIHPIVVFPDKGKCYDAYKESGIDCRIITPPKSLLQFGQHLFDTRFLKKLNILLFDIIPYSFRLWRLLKRENIEVLHCNTSRSLLLGAIVPKFFGKKVIWHVRGELNGLSPFLKRICEWLSTSIWLVAAALLNQINERSKKKTFVIYNGVSPQSVPDITHYSIDKNLSKQTVCTFAAVTPFKGYHHLIDAISIVNSQFDSLNVEFLAVGDLFDKDYITYLNYKIEQTGVSNFKFLGWQDDPFFYYAKADLVVLPTVVKEEITINKRKIKVQTGEGLPRTILEAMYLQKLIVATVVAGSPEQIINNESGFLVEPSNPEALANAILMSLNLPENKKAQIKKAAGQRARHVFDARLLSKRAAEKIKSLA